MHFLVVLSIIFCFQVVLGSFSSWLDWIGLDWTMAITVFRCLSPFEIETHISLERSV